MTAPFRWIDKQGYVRVRDRSVRCGWKYEHRLIFEQELGRALTADETVHHRNHIRSDNRRENLELIDRGEHVAHHNSEQPKRKKGMYYPGDRLAIARRRDRGGRLSHQAPHQEGLQT
jgi:hypothetical protein